MVSINELRKEAMYWFVAEFGDKELRIRSAKTVPAKVIFEVPWIYEEGFEEGVITLRNYRGEEFTFNVSRNKRGKIIIENAKDYELVDLFECLGRLL
jgi:hypothetical protein